MGIIQVGSTKTKSEVNLNGGTRNGKQIKVGTNMV